MYFSEKESIRMQEMRTKEGKKSIGFFLVAEKSSFVILGKLTTSRMLYASGEKFLWSALP